MLQKHLILHSESRNGSFFRLHCLSRKHGRIWCSATARKQTPFSTPSLIEAIIESSSNGNYFAKEVVIIDTFAELRTNQQNLQSLMLICSILEKCTPARTDISCTFDLAINLFQDIRLFNDWKTPPFILAISLFEHEGIDLSQFAQTSQISAASRETIEKLKEANLSDLYQFSIDSDLLNATFETIGFIPNKF